MAFYEQDDDNLRQSPYKTQYKYQSYGISMGTFLQKHQEAMNNVYKNLVYSEDATRMFPHAEPATAQKQYSRLQAAKAWLKERGK